jgi:DNA processing protein
MSVIYTKEEIAWLRLAMADGIGTVNFWKIIKKFGKASIALDNEENNKKSISESKAIQILEQSEKLKIKPLFINNSFFNENLSQINDCPPVIWVKGNTQLLNKASIAIVGSRNASHYSKELTRSISKELGMNGLVIVSGLARGIDYEAHISSIETGTIAVMAGGVDILYPLENKKLYDEICEKGLVVSEMPSGTKIRAEYFPRRNRIIAGISSCVLVVEASLMSGSLITSRFALEQGKEIFAVPSSPIDPRSKGCNNLIKQGAYLAEDAQDIISNLSDYTLRKLKSDFSKNNHHNDMVEKSLKTNDHKIFSFNEDDNHDIGKKIFSSISSVPISYNDLLKISKISANQLMSILAELELDGKINKIDGGFYVLA